MKKTRFVKHFSFLASILGSLLLQNPANAQATLTWARIEQLRNRVQLIPSGSTARTARVSDLLSIGDALRTASSSQAQLRFNDGSIARIGSRATFRFTPNTRNFQLSNGTVLLLVPPGQGRSTIQTPNAVTGIQGSALFVRFIPDTNTTIIGALTDNPGGPMMAYNQDGSQQQPLASGELVVVQGNDVSQPLLFDLRTFYETSGLVRGLSLDNPEVSTGATEIDAVRQEIREALEQQTPLPESESVDNPTFLIQSATTSAPQSDASNQEDTFVDSSTAFKDSPANTYLEGTLAIEQTTGATAPGSDVSNTRLPNVNETSPTVEFESSVSSDLNNTEDSPRANSPNPSDNNNDSEGRPPRRPTGTPPGQGGTPPGQGGTPPGQGGTPPGQGRTPPGQGGTPPGQDGTGTPPGQGGTPPGQGGTPPGQG